MFQLAPGIAGRLAKTALGAAALTLAALSGASAQYYPPGGGYGGPPPGYYRPAPPQRYYDDGYQYQRPRRVRMGSVCVTSRGSCQQPAYTPVGSRCFCIVPGLGKKHGVVQY